MTGAYLMAKTGGSFKPIEVEHLTAEQRRDIFMKRTPEETLKWMDMICDKLVEVEILLKQLEEDGIVKIGN